MKMAARSCKFELYKHFERVHMLSLNYDDSDSPLYREKVERVRERYLFYILRFAAPTSKHQMVKDQFIQYMDVPYEGDYRYIYNSARGHQLPPELHSNNANVRQIVLRGMARAGNIKVLEFMSPGMHRDTVILNHAIRSGNVALAKSINCDRPDSDIILLAYRSGSQEMVDYISSLAETTREKECFINAVLSKNIRLVIKCLEWEQVDRDIILRLARRAISPIRDLLLSKV
jgi:hypothetical protein